LSSKCFGSGAIIGFPPSVRVSVEFDDEPFGSGGEVGDVGRDDDLLLKFHAEAVGADAIPEAAFRLGEGSAQLLGAHSGFGVPTHTPPAPCRRFASAFPLPLKGARGVRHLPNQIYEGLSVNA
jgi:hypothetical protein